MEGQIKTGNRKQETGNRREKKEKTEKRTENSKLETRNSKPLHHLYLYCFFKGPASGPASISPQRGIDEANDTFVLSYRDLCALVSLVSAAEYNEGTLSSRFEDLGWLIPKVKRHDEIVRHAMRFQAVVPVRFCTIYTSGERVLELLRRGYEEFGSFLDFISDKEEWGVKVYADEADKADKADKEVGQKTMSSFTFGELSEIIEALDKKISAAKPGEAYLLSKKREGLIRQQSFGWLNSLSNQIYQQTLSWAIEARRNKLLSQRATKKEGDMILNAVFLLNKIEVEAFKERVESLAKSYERQALAFEISGPWPCYNFCPEFKLSAISHQLSAEIPNPKS